MSSPADQPAPDSSRSSAVAVRVEQLYASHAAVVRSVCRSLLRDRSEAEDAVQQTFLSAQRALLNGSSPREEAAWLATIARHESLARVRARMREPLPVEIEEHEAAAPDAHAAAVHRHEAGELRDALAELPAQQREAILLREMRGLSYQEVASSLAVTTSAVESLLFRARRSLKLRLQEGLAAVTPIAWIQEFAARLGGGLAGPAAAKVAVVGLGTAVATGGALVGPTVIGLGHAPAPRTSAPPASVRRSAVSPASDGTVWGTAAPHPARIVAVFHPQTGDRQQRGDTGSGTEISDRQGSSDTREREPSSDTSGSTAGDGSTNGTAGRETTSHETSDSRAGASDDGSTNSTSNTTTTDSTSNTTTTDSTSNTTTTTTTDSGSGG